MPLLGNGTWQRFATTLISRPELLFKLFVQAETKADVDAEVDEDEEVARGAESMKALREEVSEKVLKDFPS